MPKWCPPVCGFESAPLPASLIAMQYDYSATILVAAVAIVLLPVACMLYRKFRAVRP